MSTFQREEVLDQILTIVRDYFHLEGAAILLADKERRILRIAVSYGEQSSGIEIPFGKGITGSAAASKRPTYASNVSKDRRYIPSSANSRSELAIPLMVRGGGGGGRGGRGAQ